MLLLAFVMSITLSADSRAQTKDRNESPTQEQSEPTVIMFGRDDCGFCKAQFAWLKEEGISYKYLNIVEDSHAKDLYNQVAAKHNLTKVTPITVVGERVFVGFNGPETTGKAIKAALKAAKDSDIRTVEDHLARAPVQTVATGGGCSDIECDAGVSNGYVFDLPILGVVDLKSFSLFSLSAILGVIDGFNPCAMWVLLTFLIALSQIGSRKKMAQVVGLFIFAEAVMYFLILNVWYQVWDFVKLDAIVTPAVGLFSVGAGLYFLYKWYKTKDELTCEVTSAEHQSKVVNKIQDIARKPMTFAVIFATLALAFSVNIIEFACSVGIPQTFTKILEMNNLNFLTRQFYVLIYTIGYMADDIIVFALALWGYSKFYAVGQKYSKHSTLVAGILMALLGIALVFFRDLLVL